MENSGKRPYIARSSMIDKWSGEEIPVQLYQDHVHGVYNGCFEKLNRIERHVDAKWFPILKKSVLYAALYHDLGKLDEQDQQCLYGDIDGKMLNHVDAGVSFLLEKYHSEKDVSFLIASYLILAHHIGLPNYDYVIKTERQMFNIVFAPTKFFRDRKRLTKYNMGKKMVKTHVDRNLNKYLGIHNDLCGDIIVPKIDAPHLDAQSFLSNAIALKMAISILVDSDHEDSAKHCKDIYPSRQKSGKWSKYMNGILDTIRRLRDSYAKGEIRCSKERFEMRTKFFDVCKSVPSDKGFYLVDGTVGVGKTLSTMYMSLKIALESGLDSIFFILPYIALIDQSGKEYIKSMFRDDDDARYNLNIVHSVYKTKSIFHRKYTKSLTAPINLTTSVNFVNILASNCTSVFKHAYKFIGSVIVIDEYHVIANYEFWPSLIKIMKDLEIHFSCKFILSSGTPIRFWEIERLTRFIKNNIDTYNVIPEDLYGEMVKIENSRVRVIDEVKTDCDFGQLADKILSHNKSTLVIFNTRAKTVAFSYHLRKLTSRTVYTRFSGLAPIDRNTQYEKIQSDVASQLPCIVVATQGSDIGLNISFQCGFKESSSYDSILQMMGRINRGCEYEDAFIHIFRLSLFPNNDGVKYSENPSIKRKKDVFESEDELRKSMSPQHNTYMAEQEVLNMSNDAIDKMERHIRNWNGKCFEDIGEEFNLINMPMIHILVNTSVFEKMKRGDHMPYADIQSNIVNLIWSPDNMDKLKDHLVCVEDELNNDDEEDSRRSNIYGLYFWKGVYDPDNYGIFADPVFGICDLKTILV